MYNVGFSVSMHVACQERLSSLWEATVKMAGSLLCFTAETMAYQTIWHYMAPDKNIWLKWFFMKCYICCTVCNLPCRKCGDSTVNHQWHQLTDWHQITSCFKPSCCHRIQFQIQRNFIPPKRWNSKITKGATMLRTGVCIHINFKNLNLHLP